MLVMAMMILGNRRKRITEHQLESTRQVSGASQRDDHKRMETTKKTV